MLERDIPDRAYRLEGFRNRYHTLQTAPENDVLICFPALHRNNIARVKTQAGGILAGLDREKYPEVLARPRPMARYRSFRGDLDRLVSEKAKIDSGQADIARLIAGSRLVIHLEVPSTTFLECFHVDHPVMGMFFNLRPTEIVLPYYQFFFEVRILHVTTHSVCDRLRSISDISTWWSDIRQQRQYREFKEKFCGQAE